MAKHGKLQTSLQYAAAKSVLATLGRLPPPAAFRIGRATGKAAYALARNLRRTGATNLLLAFPEKTEEERARLNSVPLHAVERRVVPWAGQTA